MLSNPVWLKKVGRPMEASMFFSSLQHLFEKLKTKQSTKAGNSYKKAVATCIMVYPSWFPQQNVHLNNLVYLALFQVIFLCGRHTTTSNAGNMSRIIEVYKRSTREAFCHHTSSCKETSPYCKLCILTEEDSTGSLALKGFFLV